MSGNRSSSIYGAALDDGAKRESGRNYTVVLEGVNRKYETKSSFSIKLSLLAGIPVTRIRSLVKSCPAEVWSGSDRRKAVSLSKLIDEAGGTASIKEIESISGNDHPSGENKEKVCPKCGFPTGKGDAFCGFCMTPLENRPVREEDPVNIKPAAKSGIPQWRLLIYLASLTALLIYALITS